MIYVSSACVKINRLEEVISYLAGAGIRNIELSGGMEYIANIEYTLKALKDQYDLNYVCHGYFPPPKVPFVINLASCNDKIYYQSIEHYMNCIDMLKKIECSVLSIHAGFMIEIHADEIGKKLNRKIVYDQDKAYERFCEAYNKIATCCKRNQIMILLENNVLNKENYKEFGNHNYMMMTDYASIMHMKRMLDFDLLLDLGHLHVSSRTLGLDYPRECDQLKKYVKWIHISENDGIFDEHRPLKQNSNIMREFDKMRQMPDVDITLETVGDIDGIMESIKLIKA